VSDIVDMFRLMKQHKTALRKEFAIDCPACAIARPKAPASKLLPQQRCRVDGYRDPRPALTDAQYQDVADRMGKTIAP
jgi:hypothetical protein